MAPARLYLVVALSALVCATPFGAASASDQRDRLASSAPTPPSEDVSVFTYSHVDKTCLAWNDGCRTCLNSPANGVNCSNVGFACQIKPISCDVRRPK
jgi:hypothetical protein